MLRQNRSATLRKKKDEEERPNGERTKDLRKKSVDLSETREIAVDVVDTRIRVHDHPSEETNLAVATGPGLPLCLDPVLMTIFSEKRRGSAIDDGGMTMHIVKGQDGGAIEVSIFWS